MNTTVSIVSWKHTNGQEYRQLCGGLAVIAANAGGATTNGSKF